MRRPLVFEIPLRARSFPRPSSNGRQRFNDPEYSEWKRGVGLVVLSLMRTAGVERFEGPIEVYLTFGQESMLVTIRERPAAYAVEDSRRPTELKGDLDNYAKGVLDALNEVAFPDDRQVVFLQAKFYDSNRPDLLIGAQAQMLTQEVEDVLYLEATLRSRDA